MRRLKQQTDEEITRVSIVGTDELADKQSTRQAHEFYKIKVKEGRKFNITWTQLGRKVTFFLALPDFFRADTGAIAGVDDVVSVTVEEDDNDEPADIISEWGVDDRSEAKCTSAGAGS